MSQPSAVTASGVPPAIGPYSHGVQVPPLLFVSGQLPLDESGLPCPKDIESQARLALQNLERVAHAGGSSLAGAVKLTVYLTDLQEFAKVNEIMATTLSQPYPARATIEVAALPRGARIEIEGIFHAHGVQA